MPSLQDSAPDQPLMQAHACIASQPALTSSVKQEGSYTLQLSTTAHVRKTAIEQRPKSQGLALFSLDGVPKHTIEKSISSHATCNQAACKRERVIILKGELRFGTWTTFSGGYADDMGESTQYWAYKHWGYITKRQLKTWMEIAKGVPGDAPGFSGLDTESQEQVRLAFAAEDVVDRTFKGITLPKIEWSVEESPNGRNSCKGRRCGEKMEKGELRMRCAKTEGGKVTQYWKHWTCVTNEEIGLIQSSLGENLCRLTGLASIETVECAQVLESLQRGTVEGLPFEVTSKTSAMIKAELGRNESLLGLDSEETAMDTGDDYAMLKEQEEEVAPLVKSSRGKSKKVKSSDKDVDVAPQRKVKKRLSEEDIDEPVIKRRGVKQEDVETDGNAEAGSEESNFEKKKMNKKTTKTAATKRSVNSPKIESGEPLRRSSRISSRQDALDS